MPAFAWIDRMSAALAVCVASAVFAGQTFAAEPGISQADRAAIAAVISRQIDAFRRDDAAEAFSYASPGIRSTFGTAENFLRMVRTSYQPVYRPTSVSFLEAAIVEGEVVQKVRIADDAGAVWLALYPMERQKDGSWKTNGCQLFRLGSIAT